MKLNSELIHNWFGFTRRERRSAFILLLIIVLIITLRVAVPEKNIAIEEIATIISDIEHKDGIQVRDESVIRSFNFNPNTASYDTLIKLGLESKEANTLINYRKKGGRFRKPSDIKKIYGIDEKQSDKLIPFVKVPDDSSVIVRTFSHKQDKNLIDINNCDSLSLVSLPGIGPVLSARIIKYRHLLGGFAYIGQLKEVYGLPPETYDQIKGRIYTDSLSVIRIRINSASYKELSRLPYFEKFEVNSILKYRELKGIIKGLTDLTENKLITVEKAAKVRPYLNFEE